MSAWAAVQRYRALPEPRRRLFRDALGALLRSRLRMAVLPFRILSARHGDLGAETSTDLAEGAVREVLDVGWAVQAAAGWVPWDSRCLAQALAAGLMLQRRGLPSTLYLGVRKEGRGGFSAHAWLRCGPHFVTGGDGGQDHEMLCSFAPRGPLP